MKKQYPLQNEEEVHPEHAHEPVTPPKAVLTEPVVVTIANLLWLAFLDMAFRALQPLLYATPTHLGGLGMSPATVGLFLGGFGLLNGIAQGLFFAPLVRRVGLRKLFLTGLFCFIPLFATFPVIGHLAREWGLSPAVWGLVALQLVINCIASMWFGRCLLLDASTSLTMSPSRLSRLYVLIHDLRRGKSAGTREREWYRANRCLTRSSARPSDGNTPLRAHAAGWSVGPTRGLRRLHHDDLMRYTTRTQASGKYMGTQVNEAPVLDVAYTFWRLNSPDSCWS